MTYIYGTLKKCVDELWERIDWEKKSCPAVDFAAVIDENCKTTEDARKDAEAWFGIKDVTKMFQSENIELVINYYGGGGLECIELIDDSEDTKLALMQRIGNATDMAGYGILDPNDITLFEMQGGSKMKIKCPKCGNEFKIFRIDRDDINPDGFSTICPECVGSFDIDERIITEKMFIADVAKMADYLSLSKKSFLKSYSYLTEDEYDATDLYYDWLIRG